MAMIKQAYHCSSDLHVSSIYPTPQSYDKLLTQIKGTVAFLDFFQNEAKPSELSDIPPDIQEYNI